MSAAGGGPSGSAIAPTKVIALGLLGGLIGIYLSTINPILGPILAGLGAVCAIVWGADAIRRVASYGLGTGVPSIGYMSLGVATLATLVGAAISTYPQLSAIGTLATPILVVLIAAIMGFVVALVARRIVKMKIVILEQCTVEITVAAALAILALSSIISGGFAFGDLMNGVVSTGFIAVLYFLVTMAIQHPFNACLGPNEDQVRTLVLAAETGFASMLVAGILSFASTVTLGIIPLWIVISLVACLGWLITFKKYIDMSYEQAASVKWSGLWPKVEE